VLIGRVIGEMVATQKHESHSGCKALIVQPLQLDGSNRGDAVIAFDSVDAGVGDRVLLVTDGYAAMTSLGRLESPIDMAVIGVIDRLDFSLSPGGTGPATGNSVTTGSAAADSGLSLPLEPFGGRGQELLLPAVPVKKKTGRKKEGEN